MAKYRCIECGYDGDNLVFSLTDYTYCVATNEEDPEYVEEAAEWIETKSVGYEEIGEPIGCPVCHAWGEDKFVIIS